jgi:MoaA/NifB/PqqE/SkfB family radical SAM enzyme
MKYHVLYRGPLSSCNYGCHYCPFAKRAETHADLQGDREALDRFLAWIAAQGHCRFGVLFTPWGEALIRRWYQQALIALTHLAHVERTAIQTSLSCGLDWVTECRPETLALWTTFHPTEVRRERFVASVRRLREQGIRLSVGVVGMHEHFEEIARLREELPRDIYLWVNAYKRLPHYYTDQQADWLTEIDPLFPINERPHASRGEPCGAGETSFTVDGFGTMRRCHFVGEPIGNIDSPNWEAALRPRACPNATCGCHIGYVHLKRLRQDAIYGRGLLERIPVVWPDSALPLAREGENERSGLHLRVVEAMVADTPADGAQTGGLLESETNCSTKSPR